MRSMSFFPTHAQFMADLEHSCGFLVPFWDAQRSQLCTPYRERLLSRGTAREIAVGVHEEEEGLISSLYVNSNSNRNATRSCFDLKETLPFDDISRFLVTTCLSYFRVALVAVWLVMQRMSGCGRGEFRAVHWRYVSRPFHNLHGRVTALPSTEWPPHLLRWTQSLRRWWKMYVEHLPRMALLPTTRPIRQSFSHLSTF